jgi:hypothetical protein
VKRAPDADRMKLPIGTKCDVEREKIVDYLLNPAHPDKVTAYPAKARKAK